MEYKESYTLEEVQELLDWFKGRELPQSLQINQSTYSPDLSVTVESLCLTIPLHFGIPTFVSDIRHLNEIKEKLEELGL